MSAMSVADVMQGIADCVSVAGVVEAGRAYSWPVEAVVPPCLVVGYPEAGQPFDATFARGADRGTFPCWLVVGDFVKRTTRDKLDPYLTAVKSAIEHPEAGAEVTWQSARVITWGIEAFDVEGLPYASVKFEVDVLT